ncbi:hypothetical protein DCS_06709 [Drechmeria coniospora]|uniref:Vacuolar protein sorting-associated protein 51 homolog n=1 Tax=Drechmeria coniospora TaxID=98403 RepID=A0A151GCC2_DRECN|nr:hypothetical protein DCS_06709 [Drechmeria coniospora]KYK54749.1 hypothetical protein DCS_06709 [Drechmeria coniospora]
MSTIASPRDRSVTPLRRLPSAGNTPTSSSRPSLDGGAPAASPASTANPGQAAAPKRSNRAALREYYNISAAESTEAAAASTQIARIEVPDSEVPASDLDVADFDASAYVDKVMATCGLEDLLRLYTQVVGEVRALDAEKKALVYDNYSKLIAATETIRKMRANMDPLNPMASTLDPAIAQIYSEAASIRDLARQTVPPPDSDAGKQRADRARRQRTAELAKEVVATLPRLRELAKRGSLVEARRQWELPRRLLASWKERGVGGDDVANLMEEGDAIVRATREPTREPATERTSTNSR